MVFIKVEKSPSSFGDFCFQLYFIELSRRIYFATKLLRKGEGERSEWLEGIGLIRWIYSIGANLGKPFVLVGFSPPNILANRHLARTIAMQSLFEWDFNNKSTDLESILDLNIEQFGPGLDDTEFAKKLANGVVENLTEINKIISQTAPEWPLDQITIVDRNVLRLGIFELMFLKDVPPKVAINEAVEIGKAFGGENSGKFINGVLGTLYKDIAVDDSDEKVVETEAKKE